MQVGADFKSVGAAALAMHAILLPQWLGGKRVGHEWLAERKANGGLGDSWSVNTITGHWGCFASGQAGGDLVSLYAALNHLEQGAALRKVAEIVGISDMPIKVLPAKAPLEPSDRCEQIPPDAPAPPVKRGHTLAATYKYGDRFWVVRYEPKSFSQWTWVGGKWRAKSYPPLRRIYNLEEVQEHPEAPILVMEGEKCVEAMKSRLPAYACVSWSGGANAIKQADWQPLAGRDVLIWPDADDPGRKAAAELAKILAALHPKRVRIINPEPDRPQGWDAADAVAEGWDAAKIVAWASERLKVTIEEPTQSAARSLPVEPLSEARGANVPPEAIADEGLRPATAEPASTPGALAVGTPDFDWSALVAESTVVNWNSLGLDTNQGGIPHATLANASRILQAHTRLQGRVWYDTFRQKIFHSFKGAKREWRDEDTADLTVFIQQTLKLPKFTLGLVTEAIQHAARRNARNSLTDYLSGLVWDEEPRLEHWLADCLGVESNPYSVAISRNWPISMVARAFIPGCQVDTMPVLEGKMGRGKSSFLAALGGEWYDSITTSIGEKDFLQEIQGLWLIEIPDMTGFGRREHSQILATITIRNDRFRHSYGRFVENHPRTCVFAATSETDDYLQDIRGRRRFWPLRCTSIDLDALHAQRDQIFAEAVHRYRAGASWFEMPSSADLEQLDRAEHDIWTQKVLTYAENLWEEERLTGRKCPIVSSYILSSAIEMPTAQQDQSARKRVGDILRRAGWVPSKVRGDRCWVKQPKLSD